MEAFLAQARSDFEMFRSIAASGAADCHRLHYLQMATEKLGKAIRAAVRQTGSETHSHAALTRSLRLLRNQPGAARVLAGGDTGRLREVVASCLPIAEQIERLAPDLSRGVNPEYPWPIAGDRWIAPVDHDFDVSRSLKSVPGRRFMHLVTQMLTCFYKLFANR